MRMKAPAVLVAISFSVSACATTGTALMATVDPAVGAFEARGGSGGTRGGLDRSGLDRSIPHAPNASPYAPLTSTSPASTASASIGSTASTASPASASSLAAAPSTSFASFATSRTRYEDPLPPPSSPPPPTTAPDAKGQSTLEALATGVVLLGAGVLYLGHKIKHGSSRDDGFTIKRNGWHSRIRVSPTPTGLAVKF